MAVANSQKAGQILIVEDEMLIAMHLEDLLVELGHQVAHIITSVDKAVQFAFDGDIDLAILDVNVAGTMSYPIADKLRERSIPFLFTTGYGSAGLNEGYREEITVQKPVDPGQLSQAIAQALTG